MSSTSAIEDAAQSDLLFTLGVVGAMDHFKLSHEDVHKAIDIAYRTRGIKAITRLRDQVKLARCKRRVVTHEVSHPMIHRRLVHDGLSLRTVGKEYELTHNWVGGILAEFNALAKNLEIAPARLLKDIEEEARDLDPRRDKA